MIALNLPQRSTEWICARLWRLTGSAMKKNITAAGELSKSEVALENIDKLIAGLDAVKVIEANPSIIDGMDDWQLQNFLATYTGDKFKGNIHTLRGNDLEPDAMAALCERVGMQSQDVGMCIMGDNLNGVVSCSPDALFLSGCQIISGGEVKAPTLATYYGYVAAGVLPTEYKLQLHASMAICEVDTWHFGAYFVGRPLFYQCVKREKFTDTLAKSLEAFRQQYADRLHEVGEGLKKLQPATAARKELLL